MQRKNVTFILVSIFNQRRYNVTIQCKNQVSKRQSQRSTNVDTTLLYNVNISHLSKVNFNVQPTSRQRYYTTWKYHPGER